MGPPPALPDPSASALELFLAIVLIASPSGGEGALADALESWLSAAGVASQRDGAASRTGSDTGNLIVRRRGAAGSPTVLFVAHLDTVQAAEDRIEPVVGDDAIIRSAGETILGADNQAAVAALMWLLAHPRPEHANLVAAFTTTEERGQMGVTALEELAGEVDLAFPVDGSYPIGTVLESALGQVPFTLEVRGRRAHAAKDPDAGIHAVHAAARIVAGLEMGWVGESVLNVGAIRGGAASNVVPDIAVIEAEVRAFADAPLRARLEQVQALARAVAAETGVSVELTEAPEEGAPPFPTGAAERNLDVVGRAAARLGIPLRRESCSATLEANFLHGMGMATLGIASGGMGPHSVSESLAVDELERLCALLDGVLLAAAER